MYIISASEVRVTKAPLWFSISLKRFPATKVLKVSSSWTEGVAMEPMQQSPNWPLGKKSGTWASSTSSENLNYAVATETKL